MIIIIAFFFTSIYAQDAEKPDEVKIGELFVVSSPTGAKVYLNEEFAGFAPLKLKQVPVGDYRIKLTLKRHADYVTDVRIRPNEKSTVTANLSQSVYMSWQEEYGKVIVSSILIPGKGQVDHGKERGWGYFIGFTGAVGYAYYQYYQYHKSSDRFNDAFEAYVRETDSEKFDRHYRNMSGERADMSKHRTRYQTALIVAGGIWLANMVDAVFFTLEKPRIYIKSHSQIDLKTDNALVFSAGVSFRW